MIALGVLTGLLTALLASLAYLTSRAYTLKHGSAYRLMAISHAWQGLACLPLAWWLWPDGLTLTGPVRFTPSPWVGWVVATSLFYLLGQTTLFLVLRRVHASRISPILGIKVAILALCTVGLLGDTLTPLQWTGVVLSVAAAWTLNQTGGRLPWTVLGLLTITLVGYCGSDLSIRVMIDTLVNATPDGQHPVKLAVFGAAASYVFSGVLALLVLPWLGSRDPKAWTAALPYAACWLGSMLALFACFALVGIVLGNILQSTRGLMSIGLGALLAARGHHHLEAHVPRGILVRRTLAATAMTAAVALYVLGQ
ncbi:MAG: EamA family transporter [Planctomycetota bacterium]